jgi:single-strand DNA-binding protein
MSINRVVISGNLTRDPELRATASGMSVLKMGIAVNDRRKNQQSGGGRMSRTSSTSPSLASEGSLSRFLSKGSKVTIEGKLRWSQWGDPDGDKRSKVEIIADDIEFMSSRGEAAAVAVAVTKRRPQPPSRSRSRTTSVLANHRRSS